MTLRTSNPKLKDVPALFDALPEQGEKIDNFTHSDANQEAHIQGMSRFVAADGQIYALITHNQSSGTGYCLVGNLETGAQNFYNFDSELVSGWHHPGGIQVIGDYVIVSYQPTDKSGDEGRVFLFSLAGGAQPKICPPIYLAVLNADAACCGIAYDGKRYLMCVYSSNGGALRAYVSNEKLLGDPYLQFTQSSISYLNLGWDNMALLTQSDGKVYMIGLRGEGPDSHITDYVDLIELVPKIAPNGIEFIQPTLLKTRHLRNKGGLAGEMGPHFRWGAGAAAVGQTGGPNQLSLYCSSRHFEPTIKMTMNYWGANIA